MDEDHSGFITYDELVDVIRHRLKKGANEMSDDAVKALWCALDADDSNELHKDEMGHFFRLGAPAPAEKPKMIKKEHTSANLVGAMERHGMAGAIESTPTTEMRAELEAAGVTPPAGDELAALSKQLNAWLEGFRHKEGREHSHTWYNLFQEVRHFLWHPCMLQGIATAHGCTLFYFSCGSDRRWMRTIRALSHMMSWSTSFAIDSRKAHAHSPTTSSRRCGARSMLTTQTLCKKMR